MSVKPLLKLDNLYSLDHVFAFKITRQNATWSDSNAHFKKGCNDSVRDRVSKLSSDQHAILCDTNLAKPVKRIRLRVEK
jgi:hypothetical protein